MTNFDILWLNTTFRGVNLSKNDWISSQIGVDWSNNLCKLIKNLRYSVTKRRKLVKNVQIWSKIGPNRSKISLYRVKIFARNLQQANPSGSPVADIRTRFFVRILMRNHLSFPLVPLVFKSGENWARYKLLKFFGSQAVSHPCTNLARPSLT